MVFLHQWLICRAVFRDLRAGLAIRLVDMLTPNRKPYFPSPPYAPNFDGRTLIAIAKYYYKKGLLLLAMSLTILVSILQASVFEPR